VSKIENINNALITATDYQAPSGQLAEQRFQLTKGHWLLLLLALLCILFIAFITFARSIKIDTVTPELTDSSRMTPQAADVSISTLIKLPIGTRILVLPGDHEVTAIAQGFKPSKQKIDVGLAQQQSFQVPLSRQPGKLDISLEPKVNAVVMLDGESVGVLPGLIEGVSAGQHQLLINAPLYRVNTQPIIVEGKNQTQAFSISLEPAWADISINSIPEGAEVWFNNQKMGLTPLQTRVEEGTGQLVIKAPKFKNHQQDLNIVAQQAMNLPVVTLKPADAVYDIKTQPGGAAVIVNGEYQGISPIKLQLSPNAEQTVQLYKAGYQLQSSTVLLEPAQQQAGSFDLQQDLVKVKFSVFPADADIYIDGEKRGTGNQTILLNTLPHGIKVSKPGYVSYRSEIVPTKNSAQVVSIRLLTKEQHFWANIPETYNTKAGQSMKLFRAPGDVKMGSSRREAGRRANEVSYNVRLTKHFYASLYEVSNKQFRLFKPTHNSGNYKRKSLDSGKAPVVNISWQQAALYCNWLSKKEGLTPFYKTESGYVSGNNGQANGYRLLTESEWSWLSRNNNNSVMIYPWGNNPQPPAKKPVGNFTDINASSFIAFTLTDYNDGYGASSPIGKYQPNHHGLYDMGGNVSEWVNDWYSANTNLSTSNAPTQVDWLGPDIGEFHVVRGASWAKGHLPQLRLAYRDYGAKGRHDIGFRIGRYVGEAK